jgi:hypothetical protein
VVASGSPAHGPDGPDGPGGPVAPASQPSVTPGWIVRLRSCAGPLSGSPVERSAGGTECGLTVSGFRVRL